MTSPITIDIEVTTPATGFEIATPAVDVTPAAGGPQVLVVAVPGPRGPAGETGLPGNGVSIFNEIPSGAKDGINLVFALAHTPQAGTTMVYRNGLREQLSVGYIESGAEITFTTAPLSSDEITADYLMEG